jgi:hypothetical protein
MAVFANGKIKAYVEGPPPRRVRSSAPKSGARWILPVPVDPKKGVIEQSLASPIERSLRLQEAFAYSSAVH